MAEGDVLQIVSGHQAFAASALTSGLKAEVIGPFSVAWNTTGLVNPSDIGLPIGPVLPAGTLVLRIIAIVTTEWDLGNANSTTFEVDLGTEVAALYLAQWDPSATQIVGREFSELPFNGTAAQYVGVANSGDRLIAAYYSDADNAPTQGGADIYALVQYPL